MNWSNLQVLLAFHRKGTLQKAAEDLAVNLSTVSRRIRELEKELGVRLIQNVSGRLVLTEAGIKVVLASEAMEVESDTLLRQLSGQEEELSGVIRVGLLMFMLEQHKQWFATFMQRYPKVNLELLVDSSRLHSLNRREADVVIRASNAPQETLIGRKVLDIDYAIYAHKDLVEEQPDWRKLPWVGLDPSVQAKMTDAWMESNIPSHRVRARVDSLMGLFTMTRLGTGACILPKVYANLFPELVPMSGTLEGFDYSLWVLTHRDLHRNARVRLLMEHLYECFAELSRQSLAS
ncbi:MAG: LysR family transcriptional regulator [Deltaproteobacteria bacterium]|nr:MAG: LysR family transcriptional regulator [Deltaproteobacteria bacterium]